MAGRISATTISLILQVECEQNGVSKMVLEIWSRNIRRNGKEAIHQREEAILLEEFPQKEGNYQWQTRHDPFPVLVMEHLTPHGILYPTKAC